MDKKVYFKFYELFYRTWKKLTDVNLKAKFYESLVEYGLFGKTPDDPLVDALLTSAMNSIDKSDQESLNKSEAQKWNQNAKKDRNKLGNLLKTKQNEDKRNETKKNTWKNKKEIEREEIIENTMCDTHTVAEKKKKKIRQTSATIKAERIWKLVLRHWNEKLGRNELRNSELTQRSYALDGVDLEQIDSLIDRYKRYKEKIEEKWLQGLFFFNLNERILSDFLKNINRFEGDFDAVTGKLAKKDCTRQAIKELLKK